MVFFQGRLLLAQRPPGTHLAGLWEFPGGKREPNETLEQCVTRELQEELDVVVRPVRLYHQLTHHYPQKTVALWFFLCELVGGTPKPVGCSAVAWVDRSSIGNFPFPEADEQLLQLLKSDRLLWGIK